MRSLVVLCLLASAAAADPVPPEIRAVWKAHPDDASVLYQVAAAYARAGEKARALGVLERMERLGTGVDPRGKDGFTALAEEPRFRALKARIRQRHPPVDGAELAHVLAEADLVPEGIAWSSATRELYLGSVKRKIVAVGDRGVRDLVPPGTGGLGVVVGVRVDEARGELWAVSEVIGAPPPGVVVGVFRFRLPDGQLLRAYPVPEAQGDLLNDLVVAPDGAVFVTSSNSGALLRIDRESGLVETFLPAGSLPDPNGLAVSADGKALFVAGWWAIARVELASRKVSLLPHPRDVAAGCFDGLYLWRGDLVGVQNCVHDSGRVVRLRLSRDGRRILGADVLAAYHPLFDGVTTAAIAGDALYLAANPQFRKLGNAGAVFDPIRILRVRLP